MSILKVARANDRRLTLVAMRDKLAADMDAAPPAVVAQIAGRLSAVLAEIDALPVTGKVSGLDELAARRSDRLAKARDVEPAKKPTRQRRARSS